MQLVYSLKMGGSEKVAIDVAQALDRTEFEPHVCALDLDGELSRDLDRNGIPHYVLHRKGLEAAVFRRLFAVIRNNGIDVVHTHHFTQLFFAALPARLAGARIIHTEHEFFSYREATMARTLLGPLLRLCERMTVVGPGVADYFTGTLGIPRDRIAVIPNGVDLAAFDADRELARRDLGLEAEEMVLGTVGRLEPEKDQATLIDVFQRIRRTYPRSRLLIAGTGSLSEQLHAHAVRVGAADRTLFLGYRRDVARLLAAMDVFVLPSLREGLPISLIEAMAARRAVVASDIGSVKDLIRDRENGLVAPAGDTAAFTAAVEALLASPNLREQLAREARRTTEASYSLPAVVRTYADLYRSAAARTHVRH